MENEIRESQELLAKDGRLINPGWARHPYFIYNRKNIKAGKRRIKEWDYFSVMNHKEKYSINITISDLGYAHLLAVSYIDLKLDSFAQCEKTCFLPMHRIELPANSTCDYEFSFTDRKIRISHTKHGNYSYIFLAAPDLALPDGTTGLEATLKLFRRPEMESMNIATSWKEKPTAFYLNEKVNCLDVSGTVKRGTVIENIEENSSMAVLDWGRGMWTYKNRWYWSSLSCIIDGIPFGFNFGYGFTDRTPASENAVFYDGVVHKIETVEFRFENIMDEWKIESPDKRVNLIFTPKVNRKSVFDYKIIASDQNQVFGTFTGDIVLDDGKIIHLDSVEGFAEEVYNKY